MKNLKCVAWVIGINHYENYPDLHAAVNDAREFADKLKLLGYDVIENIDEGAGKKCTYDSILEKKQVFLDKIFEKVDIALLYFAGHGFMVNKDDCLISSDAASYQGGMSVIAKGKSIVLNELYKDMNGACDNHINILIVDACRVAPKENYRGFQANDGFGSNTKLPFQSFFAFSTSPETTASDGKIHSPYTQLLLEKMMEKDLPIENLFKSVRCEMRLKGLHQIGMEQTSLVVNYCFNHGQMEDGATLEYSEAALADSVFTSLNGTFVECLELFRTYNFYRQQDALILFHKNYKSFSEDEMFVIGRNILQAADGGCWECETELTYSRLKLYQKNGRNAVLDGILYEMYFESKNKFRKEVKGIKVLPQIEKLAAFDEFKSSFASIKRVLDKYRDKLNYIPGDKKVYLVKLELEFLGKDELETPIWELSKVEYNGSDIKEKIHLSHRFHIQDLRMRIIQYLAIPASLLKLNMPNGIDEDDTIILADDLEMLMACG